MKILFVAKKAQQPSYRFRVEQMLPAFQARGHECKTVFGARGNLCCLLEVLSGGVDVVFVQWQALPRALTALVRARVKTLVYDIDDAVMYDNSGEPHSRGAGRFAAMARAADVVVCGNRFLASAVEELGGEAVVVPTCIDTVRFHPSRRLRPPPRRGARLVVGWTGSHTNNASLSQLFPVLARFRDSIEVRVMSSNQNGLDYELLRGVPHTFNHWTAESEVDEVGRYDIGVMPMPNTNWTQGKCALKALQYMALGLPAVASPIGANREVIVDGESGFLPETPDAWSQTLERLIERPELRERIGRAGRARVEEAYSVAAVGPQLVSAVEEAACSS